MGAGTHAVNAIPPFYGLTTNGQWKKIHFTVTEHSIILHCWLFSYLFRNPFRLLTRPSRSISAWISMARSRTVDTCLRSTGVLGLLLRGPKLQRQQDRLVLSFDSFFAYKTSSRRPHPRNNSLDLRMGLSHTVVATGARSSTRGLRNECGPSHDPPRFKRVLEESGTQMLVQFCELRCSERFRRLWFSTHSQSARVVKMCRNLAGRFTYSIRYDNIHHAVVSGETTPDERKYRHWTPLYGEGHEK